MKNIILILKENTIFFWCIFLGITIPIIFYIIFDELMWVVGLFAVLTGIIGVYKKLKELKSKPPV